MNFLAHLHLAEPTPVSRLGNLLGDFVKGRPDDRFAPELWRGIMHHRHLDAFTDGHADWQRSRDRLDPARRRFAGILVDVFYDHFLSRHWDRFSPEGPSRDSFIARCHLDLAEAAPLGPPDARMVLEVMKRQAWLESYQELAGIDQALHRMAQRSPRFSALGGALEELETHYEGFESDFLAFYPEALRFSNRLHKDSGTRHPAV